MIESGTALPNTSIEIDADDTQTILDKKAAYDAVEQESAHQYVYKLQEILPTLLQSYCVQDIDVLLLNFSTKLCEGMEEDGG